MKRPTPDAATVELKMPEGVTEAQALAGVVLDPILRHANLSFFTGKGMIKESVKDVTPADAMDAMTKGASKARKGDMSYASDTLFAQAHTLDALMTEMMRRAWLNAGEYPLAFDRYMALAMKAQTQSRATLEALAKLHQPREQVVRHVHVHEGGQAVVTEEFHHHAGGQIAGSSHQPQEQYDGSAPRAALPRPDPLGNGLPVPSGEGAETLSPPRGRQGKRRAARQPKRAETRA